MNRDQLRWLHAAFLLLLLVMYVAAYLLHPALPGNNPEFPKGWWDWFDQGQYLKAAQALSTGNLDPQNFFYPPLYPALGALFVWLSPTHPFFAIDIACFLLFAFFFLDLARRYVGNIAAITLFCVSFLHPIDLVAIWIEPWTSTLVAPLFAYLFWQTDRLQEDNFASHSGTLALMGLAGGMTFATRPVDAVIIVPLFLFVAARIFQRCHVEQSRFVSAPLLKRWSSLITTGLIGVGFFCGFNWIVHGSLGGSYFEVSTETNGFHLGDLAEKAVAVFLDPNPLYGSAAESVLHRSPQLALVLPGVLFSCLFGPLALRLILLTVAAQLCIYLPYADLLPTGIWKYHNIHYFKWILPYLWICGFYPLYLLWQRSSERWTLGIRYVTCALISAVLLCVRFTLIDISDQTTITRIDPLSPISTLQWRADQTIEVDMIVLHCAHGNFEKVYFGANTVHVDGKKLRQVRDFRFLPAAEGTEGINLLFVRPVSANSIEINPTDLGLLANPAEVRTFRYGFGIGLPAWIPATSSITWQKTSIDRSLL